MSSPTRQIGSFTFPAIGFGAMSISPFLGVTQSDAERFKVLDAVYEKGCRHIDTADIYADSEELIGKWLQQSKINRSDIFLATKFGLRSSRDRFVNGDPEYVKIAIEKSLKRLQMDYVDLYYLHRADAKVPIEHTVAAMAELVKAGKVHNIGLSEVSGATLRRAHAVHPIAAVQVEYSPFTLDIEDEKIGLLKAARELGVKIVACSPMGRGLITGQYRSPEDFDKGDPRRLVPRYSAENFPNIVKLIDGLTAVGARHGATSGQVSIAWLLAQVEEDVIPIPGTKKVEYLEENLGAAKIVLSPEEIEEVRGLAEEMNRAHGGKANYPPGMSEYSFAETAELTK